LGFVDLDYDLVHYVKGLVLKMRLIRAIIAPLVALTLVFAGVGGSSAAVLCQGMDGHVEIEAAVGGVCASNAGEASSEAERDNASPTLNHRASHCGPCNDIPLNIGAAYRPVQFVQLTKINLSAPDSEWHGSAFRKAATRPHPAFVPVSFVDAGHTTLACLRTVSLLI
jgi:hypothetical protein